MRNTLRPGRALLSLEKSLKESRNRRISVLKVNVLSRRAYSGDLGVDSCAKFVNKAHYKPASTVRIRSFH